MTTHIIFFLYRPFMRPPNITKDTPWGYLYYIALIYFCQHCPAKNILQATSPALNPAGVVCFCCNIAKSQHRLPADALVYLPQHVQHGVISVPAPADIAVLHLDSFRLSAICDTDINEADRLLSAAAIWAGTPVTEIQMSEPVFFCSPSAISQAVSALTAPKRSSVAADTPQLLHLGPVAVGDQTALKKLPRYPVCRRARRRTGRPYTIPRRK